LKGEKITKVIVIGVRVKRIRVERKISKYKLFNCYFLREGNRKNMRSN
jgi:hypothetical protein